MKKTFYLSAVITLFSIFKIGHCNIWDNIYSNLNSPQYSIPDDFKLTLTNDLNQKTMSELFVSSNLDKIKLTLIMEQNSNELDRFLNILIDMKKGMIAVDGQEKCLYQNYTELSKFTVKFFLNSYDILTYFQPNGDYYDYVITNPLSYNDTLKDVIKTVYDKPYYVNLEVNKEKLNLEKIKINFDSVQAMTLTPEVEKRNMTNDDFKLINSECKFAESEETIKEILTKGHLRFLTGKKPKD